MSHRKTSVEPESFAAYRRSLQALDEAGIRTLVGGAFALRHYTGIVRDSKDFDIFLHAEDLDRAQQVLTAAGFDTEVLAPHWLGKAYLEDHTVDLIFSSGNGVARVDEAWFEHSEPGDVFGHAVRYCPVEEVIWSKSFIMERERFDGAEIAHLLHARAASLDWPRLVARYGDEHWRILLTHLVLFGFIFPGSRQAIPADVLDNLLARLVVEQTTAPSPSERAVCRGTLLSRSQYRHDIEALGYGDARVGRSGTMSHDDARNWTQRGEADADPPPA